MNKSELYVKAIELFGDDAQVNCCVEELSELISVLMRLGRKNRHVTFKEIASEIADVEIMIEQMKLVFMVSDKVKYEKRRKLKKLERYVEIASLQNCTNDKGKSQK